MDRNRAYEYLDVARRRVFDAVRPLGNDAWTREFPIGLGSLAATLTHIYISEWYYVQRMQQREVPSYETWPIRDEDPPPFADLEPLWQEQAGQTRAALTAIADWQEQVEYPGESEDGRPLVVSTTVADIFVQLVLHEVHHRAQAMNMLRHLGAPTSDLDYNAIMYERRDA